MPTCWAADYKYTALRPPALLYQFIDLIFEIPLNIPGVYYPIFHFVTPFLVWNRATIMLPQCEKSKPWAGSSASGRLVRLWRTCVPQKHSNPVPPTTYYQGVMLFGMALFSLTMSE